MKCPKFKIGDIVSHPQNLYKEHSGEIVEVDKILKKLDDYTGNFEIDGLCMKESDLDLIKHPYTFDGHTLIITIPAGIYNSKKEEKRVYKEHGYAYTIKSPLMLSIFSEKDLKKIS